MLSINGLLSALNLSKISASNESTISSFPIACNDKAKFHVALKTSEGAAENANARDSTIWWRTCAASSQSPFNWCFNAASSVFSINRK